MVDALTERLGLDGAQARAVGLIGKGPTPGGHSWFPHGAVGSVSHLTQEPLEPLPDMPELCNARHGAASD